MHDRVLPFSSDASSKMTPPLLPFASKLSIPANDSSGFLLNVDDGNIVMSFTQNVHSGED